VGLVQAMGTSTKERPQGAPKLRLVTDPDAADATAAPKDRDERFNGDALAFLQSVYRDKSQSIALRMKAAIAALPYEKPRLKPVEPQQGQQRSPQEEVRRKELLQQFQETVDRLNNRAKEAGGGDRSR
jgi:hypothetical protein